MRKQTFKSKLIHGGPVAIPHIIEVTPESVLWSKRRKTLLRKDTRSFPIKKIISVDAIEGVLGSDIKITVVGDEIIAKSFSKKDARIIASIIPRIQNGDLSMF